MQGVRITVCSGPLGWCCAKDEDRSSRTKRTHSRNSPSNEKGVDTRRVQIASDEYRLGIVPCISVASLSLGVLQTHASHLNRRYQNTRSDRYKADKPPPFCSSSTNEPEFKKKKKKNQLSVRVSVIPTKLIFSFKIRRDIEIWFDSTVKSTVLIGFKSTASNSQLVFEGW